MTRRRPAGLQGEASPRAPLAYRFVIRLAKVLNWAFFRFHMTLEGAENLPRTGGWIAAPINHRRWIDPFLLVMRLPIEPRIVFFGDGRVLFLTPFRRFLFRMIGGVVPVWPRGGVGAFGSHIEAAGRVVGAGAVFVFFPEAGPPAPPDRAREIKPGIGYVALRTRAPIVPILIGGTTELYRGRRLVLRALPAVSAAELAGLPAGLTPEPESAEEREAARRVAAGLDALTAPGVAALYHEVEARSAGDRKRWPWLTNWLELEWEGDRPHRPKD
jgi:1-acyl-sn-glycerol-3-phosphate acyltransferase